MKPHFRSADFGRRPMESKPVLLVTAKGRVLNGSWRWGAPMGLHWADADKKPVPEVITHWATVPKAIR